LAEARSQFMRMGERERVWLKIAGGVLIGAACLWLSLRYVRPDLFARALQAASWPWVAVALSGVTLIAAAKALRWQWLYPPDALPASWRTHFAILMISQMLNLLVSVIRLGELARMELMRREGRPVGMTLGTIVLEKSLDLLTVQALLLLAVPFAILPEWLRAQTGIGALVVGIGVLAALLLVSRYRERFQALTERIPEPRSRFWARWVDRLRRLLQTTLESIAALRGPRLVRVAVLTTLIWLGSAAVLMAMLVAFHIPPDWGEAFVLMMALTFSNWLPTPPAMIGVVGAVTVAVLTSFGVPPARALALGTILNVVLVAPPMLLGIWATWARLLRLGGVPRGRQLSHALGLVSAESHEPGTQSPP
jgi:uncharacterized protein (TIRG00374 family)